MPVPPFIAYALRSGSCGRPNNQVLIHVQFQQELSLDLDHFVEFAESVAMLRVRHTQPQLPQVTTTVAVACARTAAASCRVPKPHHVRCRHCCRCCRAWPPMESRVGAHTFGNLDCRVRVPVLCVLQLHVPVLCVLQLRDLPHRYFSAL